MYLRVLVLLSICLVCANGMRKEYPSPLGHSVADHTIANKSPKDHTAAAQHSKPHTVAGSTQETQEYILSALITYVDRYNKHARVSYAQVALHQDGAKEPFGESSTDENGYAEFAPFAFTDYTVGNSKVRVVVTLEGTFIATFDSPMFTLSFKYKYESNDMPYAKSVQIGRERKEGERKIKEPNRIVLLYHIPSNYVHPQLLDRANIESKYSQDVITAHVLTESMARTIWADMFPDMRAKAASVRLVVPHVTSGFSMEEELGEMTLSSEAIESYSSIAHEYGHYAMSVFDSRSRGIKGPHQPCYYEGNKPLESPEGAYGEGYANAASLIVMNRRNQDIPGKFVFLNGLPRNIKDFGELGARDVEIYECEPNYFDGMEQDEMRIAAAMWDMYDGAEGNEPDNRGSRVLGRKGSLPRIGKLGDANGDCPLTYCEILVDPILGKNVDTMRGYVDNLLSLPALDAPCANGPTTRRDEVIRLLCYNYYRGTICDNVVA